MGGKERRAQQTAMRTANDTYYAVRIAIITSIDGALTICRAMAPSAFYTLTHLIHITTVLNRRCRMA